MLEEVRRRAKSMGMSAWNPPVVTGPEMLTQVLERAGHGVCGDRDRDGRGVGRGREHDTRRRCLSARKKRVDDVMHSLASPSFRACAIVYEKLLDKTKRK